MKHVWKIKSEPDIMVTHSFLNDKLTFGKLFRSAGTQFAVTIGNHCLEIYPKLSYLNSRRTFNIDWSIYFSLYFGRYHFKFHPDAERIEKNKYFYETHKI